MLWVGSGVQETLDSAEDVTGVLRLDFLIGTVIAHGATDGLTVLFMTCA